MVDLVCVAFSDRRYLMGLPRPYGVVFLKGQKYPKALLQHADLRFATGFYASHSLLRLNPRVGLPWPPRSRGRRSTGPTTFSRSPLRFSPGTALGNSPSCGWLKHPSLASAPGCDARQRTKSRPRYSGYGSKTAPPRFPLPRTATWPRREAQKNPGEGSGCQSSLFRPRVPGPPDFSSIAANPTSGRAGPRSKWFWVLFPKKVPRRRSAEAPSKKTLTEGGINFLCSNNGFEPGTLRQHRATRRQACCLCL